MDYHSIEEDILFHNDDSVFQQNILDYIGNQKEKNLRKGSEPKNRYPNGMEENLIYQSIEKQNHRHFYHQEDCDFLEEKSHRYHKLNHHRCYCHAAALLFFLPYQINNQKNHDR